MQRMQNGNGTPVYMSINFGNPGVYNLHLNINIETNFTGFQHNYPQIGMPQQQIQGTENGHARQFGNAYSHFNNSGYCFPRPESDSSLLESSYSSGLSTPGITSNSWSYTSPNQIFPNGPRGEQFNNARLYDSQQVVPYSFSTGDNVNYGFDPSIKSAEFPVTSTPTKGGCLSAKNCAII